MKIIKALARNPHKHFIFKTWIVRVFFPKQFDYYCTLCEHAIEIRQKDLKTAIGLIRLFKRFEEILTQNNIKKDEQPTIIREEITIGLTRLFERHEEILAKDKNTEDERPAEN